MLGKLLAITVLGIITACGSHDGETSEPKWTIEILLGHEDLTRLAIDAANDQVTSKLSHPTPFYEGMAPGVKASKTNNLIMLGNLATDMPTKVLGFQLPTFLGVPAPASLSEWHGAASLQSIHFMRNYVGEKDGVSLAQACIEGKARIANATKRAVELYSSGDSAQAMMFIGHATHVIQDSFSSSHVNRSGADLRTISNICIWERDTNSVGACTESSAAHVLDDKIWGTIADDGRTFAALKTNAQAAVLATSGYLYTVAEILLLHSDVTSTLEKFFTKASPDIPGMGYFNCP